MLRKINKAIKALNISVEELNLLAALVSLTYHCCALPSMAIGRALFLYSDS